MAITNKITITQDEKEPIVIRLLEKSYAPDRDYAAGHWYVDDGNCGHDVYFMVVTPEDRFWYYNPTSTGGMLGIGARVQTRDDPLTLITHVFLFGVKRLRTGKFSVASGSGPGTGRLYYKGTTKLEDGGYDPNGMPLGKPVTWQTPDGVGEKIHYLCPSKWRWE
jgi:hypothetical protein